MFIKLFVAFTFFPSSISLDLLLCLKQLKTENYL